MGVKLLDSSMEAVFGGAAYSVIGETFRMMEVAESVIKDAVEHEEDEERRRRMNDSFKYLCPPPLLRGKALLFEKHCQEVVKRMAEGEDPLQPTDAECLMMLSELSLVAPLRRGYAGAYKLLFTRLFPERAEVAEGLPDGSYMGEVDEVLYDLRRECPKREV